MIKLCDFCTISGFTTKNIDCKTVAKIVLKGIEMTPATCGGCFIYVPKNGI